MITVFVEQIINSHSAITSEQGELVFNQLSLLFQAGKTVSLDFSNINSITPSFLNNAIGKLYGYYTSEHIKECLLLCGFPSYRNYVLNVVIENAKNYYSKPSR